MVFETVCGIQAFQMSLTKGLQESLNFSAPESAFGGQVGSLSVQKCHQMSVLRHHYSGNRLLPHPMPSTSVPLCPSSDLLIPQLFGESWSTQPLMPGEFFRLLQWTPAFDHVNQSAGLIDLTKWICTQVQISGVETPTSQTQMFTASA